MILKSFNIYLIMNNLGIVSRLLKDDTTETFGVDFEPITNSHIIQTRDGNGEIIEIVNTFLSKYTELAVGIFFLLTISLVAVSMINFASLGASSNNPRDRKMALTKILLTCISAMLMGSITLIIALFYGAFK